MDHRSPPAPRWSPSRSSPLGSRTSTLRRLVIETLAERLDSDVQLEAFSVDFFPTVQCTAKD